MAPEQEACPERSEGVALIESMNPYWVDLAEEWDTNLKASPDPESFLKGRTQGDPD